MCTAFFTRALGFIDSVTFWNLFGYYTSIKVWCHFRQPQGYFSQHLQIKIFLSLQRSFQSLKDFYKAIYWDCDASTLVKPKEDCLTEDGELQSHQFNHSSVVADHSISAGHNIKWDHFEILASGQCDLQCKIKETLLIRDLKTAVMENSHRM